MNASSPQKSEQSRKTFLSKRPKAVFYTESREPTPRTVRAGSWYSFTTAAYPSFICKYFSNSHLPVIATNTRSFFDRIQYSCSVINFRGCSKPRNFYSVKISRANFITRNIPDLRYMRRLQLVLTYISIITAIELSMVYQ